MSRRRPQASFLVPGRFMGIWRLPPRRVAGDPAWLALVIESAGIARAGVDVEVGDEAGFYMRRHERLCRVAAALRRRLGQLAQ